MKKNCVTNIKVAKAGSIKKDVTRTFGIMKSFNIHCTVAFLIRLILVAYANYHDNHFAVPYTDIDYKVFTDAARYMTQNLSPFERHTYRYTPLLALVLIPNIYIHSAFGKILFSIVDILVVILMKKILLAQNHTPKLADLCSLLWLYNPLTIVISTRGNADSIAVLLVLWTVYLLQKNHCIVAGLVHGLSIHFRLYPLVFSFAMYLSLRDNSNFLPSSRQIKLVVACVLSLLDLTCIFYQIFGYQFLYESFLYHLIRKDVRHNFSVYFYMFYLSSNQEQTIGEKVLTFGPQLAILIGLAIRYSKIEKLPFALFAQAMVMVTYNPVITSQYFFWFLSLLPLCLPDLKINKIRVIVLIVCWISSQSLWLFAAYLLEFKGITSFTYIWAASIIFFIVNIKIIVDLLLHYKPS